MTIIHVNKKELTLKFMRIKIENLEYWPDNPRIHAILNPDDPQFTPSTLQTKIDRILSERDRVKELRSQIIEAGGLSDPIVVQQSPVKNIYTVIEGNSRLAACHLIRSEKNIENRKIAALLSCNLIPQDMNEDDIFSYLSHLHVQGKLSWSPYEKARYIKRASSKGTHIDEVKRMTGLTKAEIQRQEETLEMMIAANETKANNYSYYKVAIDNSRLWKLISKKNKLHIERIIETISEYSRGSSNTDDGQEAEKNAQIFRAHLNAVSHDANATEQFISSTVSLEKAAEIAKDNKKESAIPSKLQDYIRWFDTNTTELKDFAPDHHRFHEVKTRLNTLARLVKGISEHVSGKDS